MTPTPKFTISKIKNEQYNDIIFYKFDIIKQLKNNVIN